MARERVLKSFWQIGHGDDATNLRAGIRTPCLRLKCTLSARVDRKTTPHSRPGTGWGSSNSTARDSTLAALAVSVLHAARNSCQTARPCKRALVRIGKLSELVIPTVHLPQVLSHRYCTVQARGLASTVCKRASNGSGQFASRGAICRRRSMRSTPGIAGRSNISRICASVVPPT